MKERNLNVYQQKIVIRLLSANKRENSSDASTFVIRSQALSKNLRTLKNRGLQRIGQLSTVYH